MARLKDKVAIVTGAGGGIGSATAEVMAREGARLVLADIYLPGAERVAEALRGQGHDVVTYRLDLAEPASIAEMVTVTLDHFGRVDAIANIAAELSPDMAPRDLDIERMPLDVWDRTYQVNVRGTMLACQAVLPHMVRQGGGSIINMASNLGLQGNVIQAAYASSKAAILQFTRSIAASHGKKGVRANCVSPGLTLTTTVRDNLPAKLRAAVEAETLTPTLGEPADMAWAVTYLASDESRYVTGHNLVVDGGTSTHVPGVSGLRDVFESN